MNVLIGGQPAWRAEIDQHACPAVSITGPDGVGSVMMGSPTVLINEMMACRMGDIVVEKPGLALGPANPIVMGCPTVIIGEMGTPTMPSISSFAAGSGISAGAGSAGDAGAGGIGGASGGGGSSTSSSAAVGPGASFGAGSGEGAGDGGAGGGSATGDAGGAGGPSGAMSDAANEGKPFVGGAPSDI